MIPITRKEKYINEIVGGGNTAPETPQTREEIFYAAILGEVVAPSPITRAEKYLAKIANKYSGELPEPVTRIEQFLARAAGMDVAIPTPVTREEMLWNTYIPIKIIEGIPPLTFKAKKAGVLENYRIYGNTVVGESVGDKSVNILPLSRTPLTETHGDFLCEYDGLGTITLTTDKDNATTNGKFVIPLIHDFTIPVSMERGGTGCWQVNNDAYGSQMGEIQIKYNTTVIDTWTFSSSNRVSSSYGAMGNTTINNVAILITNGGIYQKITIRPAFVENVTEQVPFEPYGKYKIPVTLTAGSAETTDIYLDEPLAKSGNNADYIDYATQKRHNSDGTSQSVELPTLQTIEGTNTLSVGTTVQPSKVMVKIGEASAYKVRYYVDDTMAMVETVSDGKNAQGFTPTKASTVQYNYTFMGWSTTKGSTTAETGVLNDITADKSLYAVFSQSLRTFTVYFYNGSTLLQTAENVQYGGTATYTGETPTKDGFTFSGWQPSNVNITADTSCYAQFVEG